MTKEVKIAINNIAKMVRKAYGVSTPIKDIDEVVKRMGGTIKDSSRLTHILDCIVEKSGENIFTFYIDKNHTKERRNFEVAHRLGHLFLNMGYKISDQTWKEQDSKPYYMKSTTVDEYNANEFAEAFLMPEDEYIEKVSELNENGKIDIKKVAEYFNVTINSAINRGKSLDCIYVKGE